MPQHLRQRLLRGGMVVTFVFIIINGKYSFALSTLEWVVVLVVVAHARSSSPKPPQKRSHCYILKGHVRLIFFKETHTLSNRPSLSISSELVETKIYFANFMNGKPRDVPSSWKCSFCSVLFPSSLHFRLKDFPNTKIASYEIYFSSFFGI